MNSGEQGSTVNGTTTLLEDLSRESAELRPQLLTLRTVASMLGVCPRSVRRLIEDGDLLACRVRRSLRVPEREVFRYVREQVEKFDRDG